jgi:hypothetical protein
MYKIRLIILAVIAAFSTNILAQTAPVLPDGQIGAAPKKDGVIRIGIVSPLAEMGNDFSFADTPMAVRNTLQVALTEEKIETVFLESALPEKEARLKKCDYIFFSKVTRKKGGGGFGGMGMLGGLAGMAGMIPGVGIAGAIAGAAASTAISVASMSGGFKSKDEVGYEYRVLSADGTTVVPPTTSKLKAKKDGEDVLTPQIAQAAKITLEKIAKPPVP